MIKKISHIGRVASDMDEAERLKSLAHLGFQEIRRNVTPATIRNPMEIKELRSVSSILMRRKIG